MLSPKEDEEVPNSLFADDNDEEFLRLKFKYVPTPFVVQYLTPFSMLAGVILRSKWRAFERMIFRVTRGNMYIKFSEIREKILDWNTGELVDKNVFILYLHTVFFLKVINFTHFCS